MGVVEKGDLVRLAVRVCTVRSTGGVQYKMIVPLQVGAGD